MAVSAADDCLRVRASPCAERYPVHRRQHWAYTADLYEPASAGLPPALVALHGGSWRSGHKTELRKLCMGLAARGFACFSIDYDTQRRSFPAAWMEGRAAVVFLRDHAAAYHVDPRQISVLGTSAGGQLAALVALAPEGPTVGSVLANVVPMAAPGATVPNPPQQGDAVPVAAAVLFNGGYDLHPKHWLLRRYLGGTCDDFPAICNDASPDFHVHPGAPPIFVGHGTHDHLIPYSQATTLIHLLQRAGDPVTPFAATGAGHSYWRSHHWFSPNLEAAVAFLQHMPAISESAVASTPGASQ